MTDTNSKAGTPAYKAAASQTVMSGRIVLANCLLLTIALVTFLNSYYSLRVSILFLISGSFLFCSAAYLFDKNKKKLLSYITLLGFLLFLLLLGGALRINYKEGIKKVYDWCLSYNGDDKLFKAKYSYLVMTGLLFISSVVTYILQRLRRADGLIAVLFFCLLILSALQKVEIPKITIGVVLFYTLSVLAESLGKLNDKSGSRVNHGAATIYLAPVCILIAVLAISLPSDTEPIGWKGVKDLIKKVERQSTIWMTQLEYLFDRTGSEFAVAYSGYAEDGNELGGKVRENYKTTLLVESHDKSTAKGYLTGSISNVYTGKRWEKSSIGSGLDKDDLSYDFYELLRAFAKEESTGKELRNLVKKRSFGIEYYNIRTRSLFFPLKTCNISFDKRTAYKENSQGAFLFKKAKGAGTRYEVQYYELNLNSNVFQDILRKGSEGEEGLSPENIIKSAEDIFEYHTAGSDFNLEAMEAGLKTRYNRIKAN